MKIDATEMQIVFDGNAIPEVRFPADCRGASPRHEAPIGEVSAEFTLTLEDGCSALAAFYQTLDLLVAAQLGPRYRERAGALERRANDQPLTMRIEATEIGDVVLWESIGTTRGACRPSNRLRKFVKRGGRLVEVRTRGRTGHRSLEEAAQAAGGTTVSMGSEFVVEAHHGR